VKIKVTGHNSPIRIPKVCPKPEVDYEAELAIVIGRSCVDVKTPEDALGCIAGFTIANDISARRWQGKKGGGQWGRSKSFDTFTPLGPCLVPSFAVSQPQNLDIELSVKRLNEGALVMQRSNTKDMIHSIGELVTYISQDTTLKPWTVILTGTPEVNAKDVYCLIINCIIFILPHINGVRASKYLNLPFSNNRV